MQNRTSEIIPGNININAAELIFYAALVLCAAIMLIYYKKNEKPVKSAFFGMITGAAALFAANFFGAKIGLAVPINGFTAFVSLTLGAPGVLIMCIISMIL